MAYLGSLITVGTYNFNMHYIAEKSYIVSRNVQDMDSYRDANGVLHRNVIEHVPIKVEFTTMEMNNTQLKDMFDHLFANFTNSKERNALCSVYVPEIDDYVSQEMYMAQPNPQIDRIDTATNTIYYAPMRVSFIGY